MPDQEINALSIMEAQKPSEFANMVTVIKAHQKMIQEQMTKGHDYGVIPGTNKPTLLKPGAEKIVLLYKLVAEFETTDKTADYVNGFFMYEMRCTINKVIVNDGVMVKFPVAQGVGSCNSKESKYRYLWVEEGKLPAGLDKNSLVKKSNQYGTKYQIEDVDVCSKANTILKMAEKRALVDAALHLANLSEIFTQDIEDMENFNQEETEAAVKTTKSENLGNFIINFGKHKGRNLDSIYSDAAEYLEWLAENTNNAEVKAVVSKYLSGKASGSPAKPAEAKVASNTDKAKASAARPVSAPSTPIEDYDDGYVPPDDSDLPFSMK